MNEFTKKELIALEDSMEHMLDLYGTQSGKSPLQEKLKSMIENYCEHNCKQDCQGEGACLLNICDRCMRFVG